jgi:GNAT superfamily N-acetyltransferase
MADLMVRAGRHRVVLTDDHEKFARRAGPWLAADPVGSTVVATMLAGVLAGGGLPPDSVWILVTRSNGSSSADDGDPADDDGATVGAGMLTPPFPVYLPPMDADAARAVVRALHDRGPTAVPAVTGVSGGSGTCDAFAQLWCELTGATARPAMAEGVHELGTLVPPDGVHGWARPASGEDAGLVTAWLRAFQAETHPGRPEPPGLELMVHRRSRDGGLLLWEDDGPVSLAGWHPPSAGVGRVGPVYTPPRRRRHGYAAAVTAAASRAVLDAGARRVVLFTDLANPTSNGVYARLGFRRIGDAAEVVFEPPDPP